MIHYSGSHKVVGVPATPQVLNLWPHARVIDMDGQRTAVIPHGFAETKLLAQIGMPVNAPIIEQYHWPHAPGRAPFAVQKATAAVLSTEQRCYCLNGMGTGKTASALWAHDFLRIQGLSAAALVVAPLSTLEFVWAAEITRTLLQESSVVHGDAAKRAKRLAATVPYYIINPDGLLTMRKELIEAFESGRITTLIIDELAVLRNGTGKKNKVARELAEKAKFVWGLTGSPTPREPTDAWGQCRIVTPSTVPRYFKDFRDATMIKVSTFKYVPAATANERVFKAMQPSVRFKLDDVIELPPVVMQEVDLPLGKVQGEVYEEMRKHALALVNGGEVSAVNAGAMLVKLLQISQGFLYTNNGEVAQLDNDARIKALVEYIDGCEEKVIVFAPYRHALQGISDTLSKEGIESAVINGSVAKSIRDRVFYDFQNTSKYKVLVAQPATMSHGLTLTAASTVIWFGPITSLETFEQANARVRRIGQKHKQLVLMFQSTAAERKIYKRLQQKRDIQDALLEMFEE